MIGLQTYADVDSVLGWNNDVKQLGGCPFHSYEWSVTSAKPNNIKPLYFRWFDNNEDLKYIGFGELSGRSLAGLVSNKTFSMGSLPAGKDPVLLKEVISDLINYCRENSIATIKVNSFGTPLGANILSELGFSVAKRWEFIIDMTIGEDALWDKLHSKKRNLIRKGLKSNLTIKIAQDLDDVMKFRNLALSTQKRKADSGITFPVEGKQQYEHLKKNVIDTGLGKLYLAYNGQETIAGAFFIGFNEQVYYVLSSANEKGLKAAAPDLLLWSGMKDYLQEGYKNFNLGGLSESELGGQPLERSGLYHFKQRFSADVLLCFKGELILNPSALASYNYIKSIKSKLIT